MSSSWVTRYHYVISAKPIRPGIYKMKDGGYFVKTGYGMRGLPDASLAEAIAVRRSLEKPQQRNSIPFFRDFAVSLLEERILKGKIQSAASRETWASALRLYLIPQFANKRLNEIDCVQFTNELAHWIKNGKPSFKDPEKNVTFAPSTANVLLQKLRTICNVAAVRFRLPFNPFSGVEFFPMPGKYSIDKPNALPPNGVKRFLEIAKTDYPQYYAMMLLGFMTGLRPSSLRALRRNEDVRWEESQLLVRRSHSRGREIMEKTKTGYAQAITLPVELLTVLREHIAELPPGPMQQSELLFPSETGGLRSRSCLDRPFKDIVTKMKVPYPVTPRAMRRSFQDLARAAQIGGVVARSISGHRTEVMQDHYSTVWSEEQKAALESIRKMVT